MINKTILGERCAKVVVVADKQPIARAALAELLGYDGYQAIQVEDLNAALAYTEFAENVVAVLVDLDLVGWRAIVRKAVAGKQILVIAMRGVQLISKEQLERLGVNVCFDKPITYGDVAYAIRTHAPVPPTKASQSTALATAESSNFDNLDRAKLMRRH
jgi:CheY-like chemotaxis protein